MKTDILLTGLVSGLTILLGVITAEWLKRLRDRISYTKRIVFDISICKSIFVSYLEDHLVDPFGYTSSKTSEELREFRESVHVLVKELRDLSEVPKWPQRNARRIRQAAYNFRICLLANLQHCEELQVLLHLENKEELDRLEVELRSATRSRRAFTAGMRDISEKKAELKAQMLSREVTSSA